MQVVSNAWLVGHTFLMVTISLVSLQLLGSMQQFLLCHKSKSLALCLQREFFTLRPYQFNFMLLGPEDLSSRVRGSTYRIISDIDAHKNNSSAGGRLIIETIKLHWDLSGA